MARASFCDFDSFLAHGIAVRSIYPWASMLQAGSGFLASFGMVGAETRNEEERC